MVDVLDDFHWHIHYSIDFLYSDNFNGLLNDLFDGNNLGNFNNSFDYLFDDLFDLNDLGDNSEDLKDIVNANDVHDLGVDHTDDSLVYVQDKTASSSQLLEFLQQGFNQNSQMELNSSALFAAVGVYVFYSIDVRNVFNYLNNSFEIISLQNINHLSSEEFRQSHIDFLSQLRIFREVSLHLGG